MWGSCSIFWGTRSWNSPSEILPIILSCIPTDDVYFPTPEPTLRLVTCGGDFDTDARSYTDNVVVFASLDRVSA